MKVIRYNMKKIYRLFIRLKDELETYDYSDNLRLKKERQF